MNNLYLIIGSNQEQINFYLYNILKDIDYLKENKITYDLTTSTLSDILDESSMMSLFSTTKIILGINFTLDKLSKNDIEYLTNYLKSPNKDAYIILIANKIDLRVKESKIFKDNFKVIDTTKTNNQEDAVTYIKDYITNNNHQINSQNLEYLTNKLGTDIYNINNELDKIFIYLGKEKEITKDTIDLLINDKIDDIIYEFTNAILDNDYNKMIKMYQDLTRENIGTDYFIVSIANSFRQSLIIKILTNQYKSREEIAKVIGKKEFYVRKMQERLSNYTETDLTNYLNKLFIIDKNIKTGKSNFDMLELFLINK